jgi:hypothetical protein
MHHDVQEWAETWNQHGLQIHSERTRSPHNIFFFSQLQDGLCGLKCMVVAKDEEVADPSTYGIDWDVMDNLALMHHHLMQNPEKWVDGNPFAPNTQDLFEIMCEPPNSPFSAAQIEYLDHELSAVFDVASQSMNVRKLVWQEAVAICSSFYE